MEAELNICAKLLELFKVAPAVAASDIKNLKIYKSQSHALGRVYRFDYKDKRYYAVDDYSLDDNPDYVRDILLDINHLLKGRLLANSTEQPDGAKFAEGLDGVEYYLWEAPSN